MKRSNTDNTLFAGLQKLKDEMTALNWYAKTEGKSFVRMQEIADEPLAREPIK